MHSSRGYIGKKLVSYLRQNDFAHAGEAEAIDLVMRKFKKTPNQKILDAGCGLGGTAKYIQDQGWGIVTGFDIENKSINYAQRRYKSIDFYVSDVIQVDQLFETNTFDIICLFNSFYAFDDQTKALSTLWKISNHTSTLAIFDYAISTNSKNFFYGEKFKLHSPFSPVITGQIENVLQSTKWNLTELLDISEKYLIWYKALINKLNEKKDQILDLFGLAAYKKAHDTYTDIYNALENKTLGGVIVYAEKHS